MTTYLAIAAWSIITPLYLWHEWRRRQSDLVQRIGRYGKRI